MQDGTIRVLVVDDSAVVRRQLRLIIEDAPGLCLLGTARDGQDALDKARRLRPDVISLDVNLPVLDGISVLRTVMAEEICPVVMVSSLTQEGSVVAFDAMECGAFDCVAKPGGTASSTMDRIAGELVSCLEAAAQPGVMRRLRRNLGRSGLFSKPRTPTHPLRPGSESGNSFKAVALGLSTGGPRNVLDVLPALPANLNAAIFMVQHMPATFTGAFARRLDGMCELKVEEAVAGQKVEPGHCYVARGGHHLTLLKRSNGEVVLRTPTQPPTQFVPSVDVMMSSVLQVYGVDTVGVLMTGMGDDGADMMVRIRAHGGKTVAESEETATVFGMCGEAIKRGGADIALPSYGIAEEIIRQVGLRVLA